MIDGITGIATLVEPRATATATTRFAGVLERAALGTHASHCHVRMAKERIKLLYGRSRHCIAVDTNYNVRATLLTFTNRNAV